MMEGVRERREDKGSIDVGFVFFSWKMGLYSRERLGGSGFFYFFRFIDTGDFVCSFFNFGKGFIEFGKLGDVY